MTDNLNLKGEVTFSRVHCSHEPDYMEIRFNEEKSGVQFLEAHMTLEDFARALTGEGRECKMQLRGLNRIGASFEHKEEIVEFDYGIDKSVERRNALEAINKLEVDGWSGRFEDAMTSHQRIYTEQCIRARVTFTRHVRDDGTPVED